MIGSAAGVRGQGSEVRGQRSSGITGAGAGRLLSASPGQVTGICCLSGFSHEEGAGPAPPGGRSLLPGSDVTVPYAGPDAGGGASV